MGESCVIDIINKVKARRYIAQPLIIHSDRGSQYVAKEYKKATEKMQRSYSAKAFPWDNACIESFHSIIKLKLKEEYSVKVFIEAVKSDYEVIEALSREFPEAEKFEENSFSGSEIIVYAIPVMTIVLGSTVLKELVKGLINNRRIKVKYKGIELDGDYKQVEKMLQTLLKEEQEAEKDKIKHKKR